MKKLSDISPAFDRSIPLEKADEFFGVTMLMNDFTFARGKFGSMAILHVTMPVTGELHKLFIYSEIIQEQLRSGVPKDGLPIFFTLINKGKYHSLSDPIEDENETEAPF